MWKTSQSLGTTTIETHGTGRFSEKNAGTDLKGIFSKKVIYESRILTDLFEKNSLDIILSYPQVIHILHNFVKP